MEFGANINENGFVIWVGIGGAIPCDMSVTIGYEYVNGEFIKPFSMSIKEKIEQLNAWHDAQTEGMKAKYSRAEIDSFLDKRNEALAWRKDNTVQTPYIMAMAGGAEAVRLALISSILTKVDAVAQMEAYVLSKRDAIEACTTQEELEAITW